MPVIATCCVTAVSCEVVDPTDLDGGGLSFLVSAPTANAAANATTATTTTAARRLRPTEPDDGVLSP
jgi:hypothetical protein